LTPTSAFKTGAPNGNAPSSISTRPINITRGQVRVHVSFHICIEILFFSGVGLWRAGIWKFQFLILRMVSDISQLSFMRSFLSLLGSDLRLHYTLPLRPDFHVAYSLDRSHQLPQDSHACHRLGLWLQNCTTRRVFSTRTGGAVHTRCVLYILGTSHHD
jgi:hypothetical protein